MVRVSKAQQSAILPQDASFYCKLGTNSLGVHVQSHGDWLLFQLAFYLWCQVFDSPGDLSKAERIGYVPGFHYIFDTAMHRAMSKTTFGRLDSRGELGGSYVILVFMDDAAQGVEPTIQTGSTAEACKKSVRNALRNSANEFEIAFDIKTNAPKSLEGVQKYIFNYKTRYTSETGSSRHSSSSSENASFVLGTFWRRIPVTATKPRPSRLTLGIPGCQNGCQQRLDSTCSFRTG